MKKLLIAFLLFPMYSFACSCEVPPVAIDFLRSDYVFLGSVIEKKYVKDSSTYTVTFKVQKHFKKSAANPQTVKISVASEGEITGLYSSCDYRVQKGEKWLVYAVKNKGQFTLNYFCSNSKRYNHLHDLDNQEMNLLEAGNEIDLNQITFRKSSIGSAYTNYNGPKPKISLDRLLAQLKYDDYPGIESDHVERLIIGLDTAGRVNHIKVLPEKAIEYTTGKIYDIRFLKYKGVEVLSPLQKNLVRFIEQDTEWMPATFMGKPVNSELFLQLSFSSNKQPFVLDMY